MTAPKIYMCYSWEETGHNQWVEDLAARLRLDGIDVKLDKWDARPGDELPHFMQRGIQESAFVLVVCTPELKTRADSMKGGVGFEMKLMMAGETSATPSPKVIPILRRGNWEEAAPRWTFGKMFLDFRGTPYEEDAYRELVEFFLEPGSRAPALGPGRKGSTASGGNSAAVVDLCAKAIRIALEADQTLEGTNKLRYSQGVAARILLRETEEKATELTRELNELLQKINLLAPKEVTQAVGSIAVLIGFMKVYAHLPPGVERENQVNKARTKLLKECIPELESATRAWLES